MKRSVKAWLVLGTIPIASFFHEDMARAYQKKRNWFSTVPCTITYDDGRAKKRGKWDDGKKPRRKKP